MNGYRRLTQVDRIRIKDFLILGLSQTQIGTAKIFFLHFSYWREIMERGSAMKEEALYYHSRQPAGKLEIQPTKKMESEWDLSLAYSPGVAEPCRAIHKDSEKVFEYTGKGNLVAVVTNGTAVLGLGSIGPLAGKPVMEGKAVLFKKFAGINVFDIEIKTKDPKEFAGICKNLEPSFGGINLEDISAPGMF